MDLKDLKEKRFTEAARKALSGHQHANSLAMPVRTSAGQVQQDLVFIQPHSAKAMNRTNQTETMGMLEDNYKLDVRFAIQKLHASKSKEAFMTMTSTRPPPSGGGSAVAGMSMFQAQQQDQREENAKDAETLRLQKQSASDEEPVLQKILQTQRPSASRRRSVRT